MWTAVAITSLIIGVLTGVDAAAASVLAKNKNSKITKKANELRTLMSKDTALTQQLLEAANRKDTRLASEIIYSSPFGTRFKQIRQEILQNKEYIDNLNKDLKDQAAKQVTTEGQISQAQGKSQTSGSVIADLLSGGISKVKSNYKQMKGDPTTDISYQPSNSELMPKE